MKTVRSIEVLAACVLLVGAAAAQGQPSTFEQTIDRITAREKQNMRTLEQYTPMVETYIQDFHSDKELDMAPVGDHYFLGRVSFRGAIRDDSYLRSDRNRFFTTLLRFMLIRRPGEFLPLGFAQMAIIDGSGFDREHYDFKFVNREFLGELRCLTFDVIPKRQSGKGRFVGRIWVEDQGYNIVRVNGVFSAATSPGPYLHFDTWRLNLQPDLWLPAIIFSEELNARRLRVPNTTAFRAQVRLWGYKTRQRDLQEFTQVVVDPAGDIKDRSEGSHDLWPVAAERAWQRQAEDNVIIRLQSAGLLAPPSATEKILETVINNVMITNNITLDPELRCRILLTAPLETFSVGHTIVVSRGLLDVLPDEATLAFVLTRELSHILLNHRLEPKYAFADRLIFPDEQALRRLVLTYTPAQEQAADQKNFELLRNSPYSNRLVSIGLFLRQLQRSQKVLPNLISPRLGNAVYLDGKSSGIAALIAAAPELERRTTAQVAALPLGGRIKINSWTGQVEISKASPVIMLKAQENRPFEITPVLPYLFRFAAEPQNATVPAKPISASVGGQ
jgi:hypothetical protein